MLSNDDATSDELTSGSRLATEQRQPLVLPVIEEHAVIEREIVEKGRVRIRKTVQEHEHVVNVMLQHNEVDVKRVAVNQFVADDAALPGSRQEGNTLIVPILREVVVTRVLLVEELHITTHIVEQPHTSTVQLRQEQIQVERQDAADLPKQADNQPPSSV